MTDELMSVPEAAALLGVHRNRVLQLIHAGELPAERLGKQWVVRQTDLDRRLRAGIRRHRPLSPRSAWALLLAASGSDVPGLNRVESARLRRRLDDLPVEDWSFMCRGRARVHAFSIHPSLLPELLHEQGVARGGMYPIDGTTADEGDAYVRPSRLAGLRKRYALHPSEQANLRLRVPTVRWPLGPAEVAPLAVVAVDLLDRDDDPSRRSGAALLQQALTRRAAQNQWARPAR